MTPTPMTWGTDSLPMPEGFGGISISMFMIGSTGRMSNGGLRRDVIALKRSVAVRWVGITESERSQIQTAFDNNAGTSATLTLPNGESFSVLPSQDGYESTPDFDFAGVPWYTVSLTLEEV